MKKHLWAVATLLAMAAFGNSTSSWSADAASDAAQVKLQAAAILKLQAAAAGAAGSAVKDIEIKSTAHMVTVVVINNKLNTGAAADREGNAARISASIARLIDGKKGFSQVAAIHVDYVMRPGSDDAKLIQGFDFFKSPAGAFAPNKS